MRPKSIHKRVDFAYVWATYVKTTPCPHRKDTGPRGRKMYHCTICLKTAFYAMGHWELPPNMGRLFPLR